METATSGVDVEMSLVALGFLTSGGVWNCIKVCESGFWASGDMGRSGFVSEEEGRRGLEIGEAGCVGETIMFGRGRVDLD